MQKVDFIAFEYPLHCFFCGKKTVGGEKLSPCKHTLYIATDEGLEYCSRKIDKKALLKQVAELGWDEATDKLEYPDSVKFGLYSPPPFGLGAYVGYAATPKV